ncbi:hypothetical protein [Thomasclavelia sp.]|uniref:hypothetical protein n=1 Tax=Thomasclavelia sp. TaxID=3025757 RepID=UPI00263489E9|nr:hypothetical protein [Thomasclavelia sp.]
MKNIICVPFAFETGYNSGVNIKNNDKLDIYLKNATVALISAKFYNPNCDVIFATNIPKNDIPSKYVDIMNINNISILFIPFESYKFGFDYKWSLAFYKLCVLKKLIALGFDNCCYMDTDVYVQGTFDFIWEECKNKILLYDINHGLNVKEYKNIMKEIVEFTHNDILITHYGGEFYASNYENAVIFEKMMYKVYLQMIESNFVTSKGDEFIVSIAAENLKGLIKNASPYICRFWTGSSFRLVSTCYVYNPVVILHMPAEKEKGIIKIYDRYISHNKIPKKSKVWKLCRLNHVNVIERIISWILNFKKTWRRFND